jgi:Glycosyl transferase family 11
MFLSVRFRGGLGNQLFQYATARSISIKSKISFLYFNVSEYKNESLARTFTLAHYRVKGKISSSLFIEKIFISFTKLNRLFTFLGLHSTLKEMSFFIQKISLPKKIFLSLDGYWQSEYYFENIRELLLEELQPVFCPAFPQWIYKENTIAIHIRRTDYLNEKRYGFIGLDYYTRAMNYCRVELNSPLFIVFSDDIDWCKKNIFGLDIMYFQEENWKADYLELYLISKCKHQIIANSSFSWWGAWLNTNENKIVIHPKAPFIDTSLLYESHYPKEWITIQN